jgi:hypothetical protein
MFLAIAAAAAFAFGIAGDVYDIDQTLKVVDRGLALETNTWLVGSKPSHKALYLRDSAILAIVAAPFVVAVVGGATAVAAGLLAAPVVLGVKHIHGGLVNKGVLAGGAVPNPNAGPARSAWWKFWNNW